MQSAIDAGRPASSRAEARRKRRNSRTRASYLACTDIAGPLGTPDRPDQPVRFRRVARPRRLLALTLLVVASAAIGVTFLVWLAQPQHVPGAINGQREGAYVALARVGFCFVILVELIRLVQGVGIWLFALQAKDPVPMTPPPGLRVALLTTIVPSKEPLAMVEATLAAMQRVRYDGHVDVWILDEGDDDAVKAMAKRLGVHHFSRKGRPECNRTSGPYRAKTKSGNHNSWRREHEHRYDVVAQMDPDHVPLPCFLERSLGYFRDPDVGFVVAPQVYGNPGDSWIAAGASGQQYLFSGVVERGGNGLRAPLLIGTNHLYRPKTWRQIGGYQDSIIEDHLTSIHVQSAVNPHTGNRWKGVYTPDVLAIGEGPTSWADYFNQQKRWSYGIWEILLQRRLWPSRRLLARQRLLYGLVQFYYPSVAVGWVLGSLATALYLAFGVTSIDLDGERWLLLWGASMASWIVVWQWLRRYNLAPHERRERAIPGMLLTLFSGPVYVAAATAALLRRPLAYAVTAKGDLRSNESMRTFVAHITWAVGAAGLLALSVVLAHGYPALRAWASLTLFAASVPPMLAILAKLRVAARSRRQSPRHPAVQTGLGMLAEPVVAPAATPLAAALPGAIAPESHRTAGPGATTRRRQRWPGRRTASRARADAIQEKERRSWSQRHGPRGPSPHSDLLAMSSLSRPR
jgi:cellulose synthase (UDP-forming)